MRLARSVVWLVVLTSATVARGERLSMPLKVAAASDLAVAFKEVGTEFEKQSAQKVVFSFGSTGLLAKQIEQGAPYDVFAAANVSFVDETVAAGVCAADSKTLYAR